MQKAIEQRLQEVNAIVGDQVGRVQGEVRTALDRLYDAKRVFDTQMNEAQKREGDLLRLIDEIQERRVRASVEFGDALNVCIAGLTELHDQIAVGEVTAGIAPPVGVIQFRAPHVQFQMNGTEQMNGTDG